MPYSKKTDSGLDIDGLSTRASLDPEYVIGGAFPEQRHHLISLTTVYSPSLPTNCEVG